MQIIRKDKVRQDCLVSMLHYGDCFEYMNRLHMRICDNNQYSSVTIQYVLLRTGLIGGLNKNTIVLPVKVTAMVEE